MYWNNGAQIIPPHDHGISEEITRNLEPWHLAGKAASSTVQPNPFDASHPRLSDPYQTVTDAYFAQAARDYCWRSAENRALTQSSIPVTYTAMHGVGAPFTARALEVFGLPAYIPTPSQVVADPEFPTVKFPNPEEGKGALALAMASADAAGSELILANDPDADRLAVAEKVAGEWKPLNGNQIALLLADWTFQNYLSREKPSPEQLKKTCMIASTVSSGVLGAMAAKEGFNFYPTLTGFKWQKRHNATTQVRHALLLSPLPLCSVHFCSLGVFCSLSLFLSLHAAFFFFFLFFFLFFSLSLSLSLFSGWAIVPCKPSVRVSVSCSLSKLKLVSSSEISLTTKMECARQPFSTRCTLPCAAKESIGICMRSSLSSTHATVFSQWILLISSVTLLLPR